MNEFLSEQEKKELQRFVESPIMLEAVKKVLLFGVYHSGTLQPGETADINRNFAYGMIVTNPGASNESLGADLRAKVCGIGFLSDAFKEIEKLKIVEAPKEKKLNSAR